MSEQGQTMVTVDAPVSTPAGDIPVAPRPQPQAIADPRQIAAVVMARMNLINAKKDELTIEIKGLTDLTQQLVQAYAAQMQALESGKSGTAVAWKNPDSGRYGSVVPGPAYQTNGQQCRQYTHTIYIDGQPQVAKGNACRNPDGTWTAVG